MANRNYGGRDDDDRNRTWGRDLEEGRGSSGRDWGAGERGWGRGDWETQGGGREGQGREGIRNRENESWGGERGAGRDVDWRSDWQQRQQDRGGSSGGGYAGGSYGGPSGGGYTGGYSQSGTMGGFGMNTGAGGYGGSGDRTTNYGTYSQGRAGSGQWGQGNYGQGGYGQSGSGQSGQGSWGQSGASQYGQGGYGQAGNYSQGGYGQGESWSQGPHTGRGPQGYQRSNERIKEEICEVLTRHGQVDARNINIRVENGEVTLEGTVESRREKRLAEEAIEHLSGVKDVHNQLRVSSQQSQQGNGGTKQETSAAFQAGLQSGDTGSSSATGGKSS